MRHYIPLAIFMVLISCSEMGNQLITDKKDYNVFLASEPVKTTSKYFELWNSKIKEDSMQLLSFGVVGGEYSRYFQHTGDIQYLKKAEKALQRAVRIAAIGKAGYYRSLARNYISQHRFKEALVLADSARTLGSGVNATQSLLFDLHMELGNYDRAGAYLDSIANFSDFGYLIRLAKWNDQLGDLDQTIRLMEKAMAKVENSKNKDLMLWCYTNIADYYGHAGRIQESYDHYLKSLAIDPQNAYAKKGIAWIVFSYEKNSEEALRILDSVIDNHKAPDYYLLKSEIAEYHGDSWESLINLDRYMKLVQDRSYGDMYNVYNISVYLERTGQYEKALWLAKREVDNRPTPESYSLLAYTYFKMGELSEALHIVEKHIEGQSAEPGIHYRIAEIYKASGNHARAMQLKEELNGAIYELGPQMAEPISRL
ncbi:MAG: tetratricopeptide repeat protein [Flavobacteriaceae bacterium]